MISCYFLPPPEHQVAVLAIMAAHEKSVRDEVFDRVDFMMELRFAMEMAMKRLSLCGSLGESRVFLQ